MFLHDEICKLPVSEIADSVLQAASRHNISILKAPPGSGKSTALPAILLEKNVFSKKILMLEPRRIACMMVAERIAYLLGGKVGEMVGYRMRGDTKISSRTRLEIVTEGTFTRMIQNDVELADYDLIIFDEFHERNIHSDLGLALALDVRNNLRNDLSLLVMSATLDIEELHAFIPESICFECGGRMFDTEIFFAPERIEYRDIVSASLRVIKKILNETESGNILVFFPGAYEICKLASMLETVCDEKIIIAPLYGALSRAEQQKALKKTTANERKIVIATNIAESSVTIDDIKFVIDSGWEKKIVFSSSCGMDKLQQQRIAKSSAIQRGGRAGRTSNGQVYRLYTKFEYETMADYPTAEIGCVDLSNFCLELALWGCQADELKFLTPPKKGSLLQGFELLHELDLLDEDGKITSVGRRIAEFPGHCRVGKMFDEAQKSKLQVLGCEVAAMLEEKILPSSDLQHSIEILRQKPTASFKRNLELLLREKHLQYHEQDLSAVGQLLFGGFPDRVGKRRHNSQNEYQLANGRGAVLLNPIEGKAGEFIIAPLVDMGDQTAKITAAAVFDEKNLPPDKLQKRFECHFDEQSGVFITEQVISFEKLILERKKSNEFDLDLFKKAVLEECRKRSFGAVFKYDDTDENFLHRCQFAHFSEPEKYPEISEEILLADCRIFDTFDNSCRSLNALKKIPFKELLQSYVGYEILYSLNRDFPEKYLTPGGANYKIRYEAQDAILSVPISQMYGTSSHPTLGRNKFPLKIELLSPAMRPVQITRNLPEFWHTNWEYVKKEMKQRYIKHFWPDDPANALPGKSIRKK